jgi:hypothetical protein
VLGIDREWPELFDVMVDVLEDKRRAKTRDGLAALARKQFGGSSG